jgi:uncharacterized hydrophobic protein (TIGR00271 family)
MTATGPGVTGADVDRMVDRMFLGTPRQRSAFWVLLVLAAIIAGAGVVADSVATVIGAMIVAPLMTPILGTALALVLADSRRVVGSALLVVAGAAAVVAIGYALGLLVPGPVVAETNSQVASRVAPKLIDLVSALATGAVGAFALVRSDVSDTLPGVAIAISLVPPLAVVGLTLEADAPDQAAGSSRPQWATSCSSASGGQPDQGPEQGQPDGRQAVTGSRGRRLLPGSSGIARVIRSRLPHCPQSSAYCPTRNVAGVVQLTGRRTPAAARPRRPQPTRRRRAGSRSATARGGGTPSAR